MSAIVVLDPALEVFALSQFCDTHITVVLISLGHHKFHLFNVYCQFSQNIDPFLHKLDHIIHSLNTSHFIICMDANAKSPLWHSNALDSRGSSLEDFIVSHRLEICNIHGQPSTFWTTNGESNIDVTLVSSSLAGSVGCWRVYDGLGVGDHRPISFTFNPSNPGSYEVTPSISRPRFLHSRADWELFDAELNTRIEGLDALPTSSGEVESLAASITSAIHDSALVPIPVSARGASRVGWWSEELSRMKSAVNRERKILQRAKSRNLPSSTILLYLSNVRTSRNRYTAAISVAKFESWSKFVSTELKRSPWGVDFLRTQYY